MRLYATSGGDVKARVLEDEDMDERTRAALDAYDRDAPLRTRIWELCTRGLRYADTTSEKVWAVVLFPICLLCVPVVLLWMAGLWVGDKEASRVDRNRRIGIGGP